MTEGLQHVRRGEKGGEEAPFLLLFFFFGRAPFLGLLLAFWVWGRFLAAHII